MVALNSSLRKLFIIYWRREKEILLQEPPLVVSPRIVAIIMVCHIIIIMYAAILRHFFEGPIMTSCNSRGTSFLSKIYVQHTEFVSSLYATTFRIVILPIFSDNMPFPKKKDLAYKMWKNVISKSVSIFRRKLADNIFPLKKRVLV